MPADQTAANTASRRCYESYSSEKYGESTELESKNRFCFSIFNDILVMKREINIRKSLLSSGYLTITHGK
jgi:hypothetical protein